MLKKIKKQTNNRKNVYTDKKVKTQFGEIQIEVSRDRNGGFEPIVALRNKRDILE